VTGVRMVYMAAELAKEPGVMTGPSDELAEVRWVSSAEAWELIRGMSEDVRQYLAQVIGD
jgi:hypothetical protein